MRAGFHWPTVARRAACQLAERARGDGGAALDTWSGVEPDALGVQDLRGNPAGTDDELIEAFDLGPELDKPVRTLSGGNRQKVSAALAFLFRPDVLILDEPTAGLDPLGRRDVLEVMRRLQETATVFYSTHILDDVQQVSDEVAILKAGRRVLQAPMSEVLRGGTDRVFDLELAGPVLTGTATVTALRELSDSGGGKRRRD